MSNDFELLFCLAGRIDREMCSTEFFLLQGLITQFKKYRHIEEVHNTEDKDDGSHLNTEYFDELPGIGDILRDGEGTNCVTDVDQIEPNQQEIVNGISQGGIAVENIYEKDLPVAEKSAGYPNGQSDGQDKVKAVGGNNVRHDCMI
jgi:hypothetical protein